MSSSALQYLRHAKKQEWGLGRVIRELGGKLEIEFEHVGRKLLVAGAFLQAVPELEVPTDHPLRALATAASDRAVDDGPPSELLLRALFVTLPKVLAEAKRAETEAATERGVDDREFEVGLRKDVNAARRAVGRLEKLLREGFGLEQGTLEAVTERDALAAAAGLGWERAIRLLDDRWRSRGHFESMELDDYLIRALEDFSAGRSVERDLLRDLAATVAPPPHDPAREI